ncbi:MAG: DUF2179 domain-containing protein [Phycisphaeraceae bacterium]|nr:DUF2179 domain-containing protein [Phycisphaeraceae bacterium]MBX3367733.1 DUF2179 domain-containing protein [Phycisphaeraceae bacterium]
MNFVVNSDVLLTCLLIVLARVTDVSLGTIRTITVINGLRGVSWILGFFEVLVWIVVVSRVIGEVPKNPLYPVAYALGFATGNFIGITIESKIAFGHQVVRVFTRKGPEVVGKLREDGYAVTEFSGRGRDGPVDMLFIETERRTARELLADARKLDPDCFVVVDDIRIASAKLVEAQQQSGGWRSQLKRK